MAQPGDEDYIPRRKADLQEPRAITYPMWEYEGMKSSSARRVSHPTLATPGGARAHQIPETLIDLQRPHARLSVTVLQCREGPIPPNPSSDADPSSRPFARAVIRRNIWYYRDRTGLPRGPMTVDVLRKAYIGGIIDGNTLMWGNGLGHWVPLRNIRGMDGNLPKVLFLKWIRHVHHHKAQRRERRNSVPPGLAKSTVMNTTGSSGRKPTEKLRSGGER